MNILETSLIDYIDISFFAKHSGSIREINRHLMNQALAHLMISFKKKKHLSRVTKLKSLKKISYATIMHCRSLTLTRSIEIHLPGLSSSLSDLISISRHCILIGSFPLTGGTSYVVEPPESTRVSRGAGGLLLSLSLLSFDS